VPGRDSAKLRKILYTLELSAWNFLPAPRGDAATLGLPVRYWSNSISGVEVAVMKRKLLCERNAPRQSLSCDCPTSPRHVRPISAAESPEQGLLVSAKSQAVCKNQLPLRSVGTICTSLWFDCCVFQSCRRKGYADFARRRLRSEPIAVEARDKCPTFKGPAMRTCCKKCNPLEIAQPHWLQSGAPPKIHGATRVDKSAE